MIAFKKNTMKENFQNWLINKGYYRENGNAVWKKDGIEATGKELSDRLNEYKALNNN